MSNVALRWLVVLAVSWILGPSPVLGDTAADDVKWLVTYDAKALPQSPAWTRLGGDAGRAEIRDGALHLVDDSKEAFCCYRAAWKADPSQETIVEARVRVASVAARRDGDMHWPWIDGSPVSILVSDGRHQEGLVLCPRRISTFLDRFHLMNTADKFHVYRLVIRGTDMSVSVDDQVKIRGKDAFWKPAAEPMPFVQFGSSSKAYRGEASWEYVKLGVRPMRAAPEKQRLKITVSEPWKVPKFGPFPQTRPYLYEVGEGTLLLSVAQGPDKWYEPYGVLKSTDAGKTWTPLRGLQEKIFAPQPMIRLADGSILGVSRWNLRYEDYRGNAYYVGMSYLFGRTADSFQMFENKILVPKDTHQIMVFDRHIFDVDNGTILAVVYDGRQHAYLLQTKDAGKTWNHFSTIGKGDEPSVTRISEKQWTALLRQGSMAPLHQVWSHDGGKNWSQPTVLEEGSVDADVITMSSGVLACSYGRPGSNLMFSTDRGKTWSAHRVITDRSGFNYTAIREVRSGRLLYLHDAPPLTALYVDVELPGGD